MQALEFRPQSYGSKGIYRLNKINGSVPTMHYLRSACLRCIGSHRTLFGVSTQILTDFDDCCTASCLWDKQVSASLVQSACFPLTQYHAQPGGSTSFRRCSRNGMLYYMSTLGYENLDVNFVLCHYRNSIYMLLRR